MTFKQITHRLNRRDTSIFPKIPPIFKYFLITLIIFSTIFTVNKIFAADVVERNQLKEKQEAILKGNNQESWLDNAIGSNAMSLHIIASGTFPEELLKDKIDMNQYNNAYIPGGIIGITNQVIASTYNPTASGIEYIAELKNNFFGKPAYAANETGFNGLKPIMKLWATFRNVVYVLISLYFVILGIIIMLRVKISPQAVVTIQSSLPKVITTLVLVTFSYAIAGFCIDLVSVFQALCISLLYKAQGETDLTIGLFKLTWGPFSDLFQRLRELFRIEDYYQYKNINNPSLFMIKDLINRLAPNTVMLLLGAVVGAILGTLATPGVGTVIGLGGGAIVFSLILAIYIIFVLIKLCLSLCKTYLTVLIQIVFSPFLIFVGIFPTSKKGFSDWLTNLIAHLAVFPITLLFLLIANMLIDTIGGNKLWSPVLVPSPFTWFLPAIVGVTAISMLSKLPQIVPEAIFGLKPSPLGKAIGEGFAALPGAGTVRNIRQGSQRKFQERIGEKAETITNKGIGVAKEVGSSISDSKIGHQVRDTKLGRGFSNVFGNYSDSPNPPEHNIRANAKKLRQKLGYKGTSPPIGKHSKGYDKNKTAGNAPTS